MTKETRRSVRALRNAFSVPIALSCVGALLILSHQALADCIVKSQPDRTVFIGDSLSVGPFGAELETKLKTVFPHLQRFAVSGSAADHWDKPTNESLQRLHIDYYCDGEGPTNGAVGDEFPSLTALVTPPAPLAVIVALATNDMFSRCQASPAVQMKEVKALLAEIPPASTCVWVAPPTITGGDLVAKCGVAGINGFRALLKQTVEARLDGAGRGCAFIDSTAYFAPKALSDPNASPQPPSSRAECDAANGRARIEPNQPDRTHYRNGLGRYWGDCAAFDILNRLKTSASESVSSSTTSSSSSSSPAGPPAPTPKPARR